MVIKGKIKGFERYMGKIFRLTHRSCMTTLKYENDEYQEKNTFMGKSTRQMKLQIRLTRVIKAISRHGI